MASILADENVETPIIESLRVRGHDVLTVRRANLLRVPDLIVLAEASKLGRAVLTHDRDFVVLHKSGVEHAGIVFVTYDSDFEAVADRIHEAVSIGEAIVDRLIRVYRPG